MNHPYNVPFKFSFFLLSFSNRCKSKHKTEQNKPKGLNYTQKYMEVLCISYVMKKNSKLGVVAPLEN